MFTTCRRFNFFLKACKHLKKGRGLYLNIPAEPLPFCHADSKRGDWSRLKRTPRHPPTPSLLPTNKRSGERSEPALCQRSLVPLLSCLCSRFSSDGVSIVVFLPSDKNAPFQQILSSCPLFCSLPPFARAASRTSPASVLLPSSPVSLTRLLCSRALKTCRSSVCNVTFCDKKFVYRIFRINMCLWSEGLAVRHALLPLRVCPPSTDLDHMPGAPVEYISNLWPLCPSHLVASRLHEKTKKGTGRRSGRTFPKTRRQNLHWARANQQGKRHVVAGTPEALWSNTHKKKHWENSFSGKPLDSPPSKNTKTEIHLLIDPGPQTVQPLFQEHVRDSVRSSNSWEEKATAILLHVLFEMCLRHDLHQTCSCP